MEPESTEAPLRAASSRKADAASGAAAYAASGTNFSATPLLQ